MQCDMLFTHHFRQELGGQIMNGFAQDTHGGQDENDPQYHTGSDDGDKIHLK